MNALWQLPVTALIGGKRYELHGDFRDILEIFSYLENPDLPEYARWRVAVALFYEGEIPEADYPEALAYLVFFIGCGQEAGKPGPKLLDWEADAMTIIADINKVAGQEIRSLPFVHWWTFMAWFHGIGEGQLSTIVGIRDKLRKGKKLEPWEQEFYRENKHRVDMKKRYSKEELEAQARIQALLG